MKKKKGTQVRIRGSRILNLIKMCATLIIIKYSVLQWKKNGY